MLSVFVSIVRRDLLLAYRRRSDVATTLIFFVVVTILFPFGIGPEKNLLRTIAPGIVWVAALLSSILSLERMFALDYADGTLEQTLLSSEPLSVIVIAKVIAHWLVAGLPLVLLAPVLVLPFDLDVEATQRLALSLLLGTPILSLFGAIGAALTLGTRSGSVLLALLILPLNIPVLIFGAGSVSAEIAGQTSSAQLLLLAGILAGAIALTPWVTSAALRISHE